MILKAPTGVRTITNRREHALRENGMGKSGNRSDADLADQSIQQ